MATAVPTIFGVDPFTHNGLMPKALLVFVGLAAILALAGQRRSRDN